MNWGVPLMLVAMLMPAVAEPSTSRELRFKVLLDDREVGSHRFQIIEQDGHRQVQSDFRVTVKFLFIDAYNYVHQARERWRGDCLEAIESRTDADGERRAVQGRRGGDRLRVVASDAQVDGPSCVMSFAYWNPAILEQSRLLNAETGEIKAVRVEALGQETVMVRGASVVAKRYALHARDLRIDVWYAAGDQWVQLESRTEGDRVLTYRIR
ncbi:MAG: DUF6134 family protein [Gammaproteobacteria bacterium]